METIKTNSLVVKSHGMVEAKYRLTPTEVKLIAILSSCIQKEDKEFKEHRFKTIELLNIIGLGDKNNDDLKLITENLIKKVLKIKEKDKYIQIPFLTSARYFEGKGIVGLSFSPYLSPYLLQLKESFVKYKLDKLLCLKSFYSFRFYELLVKWEKIGKFRLSIEKIREMFDIKSDVYPKYSNFKQKVILKAQEELKEKADLYFEFIEIKSSRKVSELEFIVVNNNKNQVESEIPKLLEQITVYDDEELDEKKVDEDSKTIREELKKNKISKSIRKDILQNYPKEVIKEQLKYIDYRETNKNRAGMLVLSIKENWAPPLKYTKVLEKEIETQKTKSEFEKMKEIIKSSKYIIRSNGEKNKILEIQEENIKIEKNGNVSNIPLGIALKCKFEG